MIPLAYREVNEGLVRMQSLVLPVVVELHVLEVQDKSPLVVLAEDAPQRRLFRLLVELLVQEHGALRLSNRSTLYRLSM